MVKFEPLQFPKEIVSVILDFEGSLIRSWKLDYIQSIYIEAYKRYFGKEITFRKICNEELFAALHTLRQMDASRQYVDSATPESQTYETLAMLVWSLL